MRSYGINLTDYGDNGFLFFILIILSDKDLLRFFFFLNKEQCNPHVIEEDKKKKRPEPVSPDCSPKFNKKILVLDASKTMLNKINPIRN